MSSSNTKYWTYSVALAGFLFGFDTVVISGANLPVKELWNTSPTFHGWFIMSMALWGTVVGALFGGIPTDRLGRKKTLLWIGILFAISAIGSALAPDPYTFSFFRFIGGLGVGASSVTVPTYLSEVSEPKERGSIVARYQFMLVLGILIAFISNYLLTGFGGNQDWRYMLGVEAIPAVIYSIMVMSVPGSPRWLLLYKNDEKGARSALESIGHRNIDQWIGQMKSSSTKLTEKSSQVFNSRYRKPLFLAFCIAAFNQLSGINFVLYYAPEIFENAGLTSSESLSSSVYIGLVNLAFTILGMYLIDRLGRKTLLFLGSLGYIISLLMVAYAFYAGAASSLLLFSVCLFIASHAIGQGAVIWVFISEIFPTSVRANGQAWGSGTHWVFAALITAITPYFLDNTDGIFKDNAYPIFLIFAVFMVFQLLWVVFLMPETKGKSLEEIETELASRDIR